MIIIKNKNQRYSEWNISSFSLGAVIICRPMGYGVEDFGESHGFLVHQRSPTEYSGMGGGLNKIYANWPPMGGGGVMKILQSLKFYLDMNKILLLPPLLPRDDN